ncbi:MAG: hypothetical protein CL393_08530 [Acidiferrobacteraceae bacterium]|jgi:hypothetical protein|nr:hypothetical protein [Acidiferrobacteraceae bacterium]|tara:strand:+ start:372 stop:581 length:210 start_codon:yes stop_codon:yes gene_type:complete
MIQKYLRPNEVKELYGINPSTLSKQRNGKYGLPFHVVGRNPNKNRGGIILYNIDEVENYLNKNKKKFKY